jgi:hypothetical protein
MATYSDDNHAVPPTHQVREGFTSNTGCARIENPTALFAVNWGPITVDSANVGAKPVYTEEANTNGVEDGKTSLQNAEITQMGVDTIKCLASCSRRVCDLGFCKPRGGWAGASRTF